MLPLSSESYCFLFFCHLFIDSLETEMCTDNTLSCYRVEGLGCGLFDPWPVHATNKTTSEGSTALLKHFQALHDK